MMHLREKIPEDFSIGNAQFSGLIHARLKLKSFFDTRDTSSMLPLQWSIISRYPYYKIRQYKHGLLGEPKFLAPLQRNFITATFIATKYCAPQITNVRKLWRSTLLEMPTGDSV